MSGEEIRLAVMAGAVVVLIVWLLRWSNYNRRD